MNPNGTTPARESATPRPDDVKTARGPGLPSNTPLVADPLDIEDAEEYTLNRFLGLRPRAFSEGDQLRPDTHPDSKPCPSWCWLPRQHEHGYSHEIDEHTPFSARHTLEHAPIVASSYYAGDSIKARPGQPRRVLTATIEPMLEQWGTNEPRIPIGLRYIARGESRHEPRRLVLTLEDAQDLILALQYLVDLGMNEREGHLPC